MKKLIIEFNVDQELEFEDICNPAFEAAKDALFVIDTQLDRIGNGRGSAGGVITIRFNGFDGVNRVSTNNGLFKIYELGGKNGKR